MRMQALVLAIPLLLAVLTYPSLAAGIGYTEYQVGGLRVVVVEARNPSYSFDYCGVNYIDFNASDDYAVVGLQGIPGLSRVANAGELSRSEVARALRGLRDYTIWYNDTLLTTSVPSVVVRRDYGVLEVLVKPGVDPLEASKRIAGALRSLMATRGYTTLVVVRALSDLPPSELEKAFERVSGAVMGAVFNPPNDAPQYQLKIAELQRRALESGTRAKYITVGIGAYGSIGVTLWGPEPTKKDLEELARWIRDKTGECTAPLYILYGGPTPPQAQLLLDEAEQTASSPTRDPTSSPSLQALLAATVPFSVLLAWSLYRARRSKFALPAS